MGKGLCYLAAVLATVYMGIIYNRSSLIFLAEVELFPLLLLLILTVQRAFLRLSFLQDRFYMEEGQKAGDLALRIKNVCFPIRKLTLCLQAKNLTTGEGQEARFSQAVRKGVSSLYLLREFSCGVWQISCEKIRLSDFLLFFRIRKRARVRCELVCLPRTYKVKGILFTEEADGEEAADLRTTGGDASVVREIREYRPGDRLRNVHWKLSAKKESLQVKEYGCTLGGELMFGLDCGRLDRLCLEVVYSLLQGCMDGRCRVRFLWMKPEGEVKQLTVTEEEQAAYALELLMRQGAAPFPEEQRPRTRVPALWLSQGRTLTREGKTLQEFSEEGLERQLSELEIFL